MDHLGESQDGVQFAEIHNVIRAVAPFYVLGFFYPLPACFVLKLTSRMLVRWLQGSLWATCFLLQVIQKTWLPSD